MSIRSISSQIQDLIQILDQSKNHSSNVTFKAIPESKSFMSTNAQSEIKEEDDNMDDGRLILKTPRGTRDYNSGEMQIREQMLTQIKYNFNRFGGQSMETPVFELRNILMDKYGEDEKLIYDLAQQESETLCLRYDLTVPLARYVAMNRKNIRSPFKAARVGRVYRRDQPYMTRGRLREFWQCDFDIVRTSFPTNSLDLVLDDSEIIAFTVQQLLDFNIDCSFVVLINNRKLLDIILDICDVNDDQIRPISSAIDKMDKSEWCDVKQEMIEKGITGECAENIRTFVSINGHPMQVIQQLKENELILRNMDRIGDQFKQTMEEFDCLFKFLDSYNPQIMQQYLQMDMSMVRGLDYYTGLILEARFADTTIAQQYGSIVGGGRYDKLISGLLSSDSEQYPCVGVSLGFERIFSYLKNTNGISLSGVSTDILICEVGPKKGGPPFGLYDARLNALSELRDAHLNAEIVHKLRPNFREQINYAEWRDIKWLMIIGSDEVQNNTCNLRRIVCTGDTIVLNDGRTGVIQEIIQPSANSRSKWPEFKVIPCVDIDGKQNLKVWTVNKKEMKFVIENGQKLELQMKGMPRNELIPFFSKSRFSKKFKIKVL